MKYRNNNFCHSQKLGKQSSRIFSRLRIKKLNLYDVDLFYEAIKIFRSPKRQFSYGVGMLTFVTVIIFIVGIINFQFWTFPPFALCSLFCSNVFISQFMMHLQNTYFHTNIFIKHRQVNSIRIPTIQMLHWIIYFSFHKIYTIQWFSLFCWVIFVFVRALLLYFCCRRHHCYCYCYCCFVFIFCNLFKKFYWIVWL